MKKKISIFTLLLSLSLLVVSPLFVYANSTVTTADDVKYKDIEDFMHSSGYTSFVKDEDAYYFVGVDGLYYNIFELKGFGSALPYACSGGTTKFILVMGEESCTSLKFIRYYKPIKASEYNDYNVVSTNDWSSQLAGHNSYFCNLYVRTGYLDSSYAGYVDALVYSDLDVYENLSTSNTFTRDVSTLLFESSVNGLYTFPSWCIDADLNCLASTNESPSKIPYSYNDYWHIVRKTSNGKWLLTTIGNSVMADYPDDYKLFLEDGNLVAYSIYGGDDVNGYLLNVRQYEYDTDGWKVRTYDTYDFRETSGIVDLGSGSGFDDTRKLAYNNVGIFVGIELNPTYPASTEYYEITTPDVPDVPDVPISTPTPTSTPSGGGSGDNSSGGGRPGSGTRPDTGGQATGGGGLDFIINLFTLIWTKICSIPMAVDGYSISLQQIIIYGALVSIVGGFIMHFIFGRK